MLQFEIITGLVIISKYVGLKLLGLKLEARVTEQTDTDRCTDETGAVITCSK